VRDLRVASIMDAFTDACFAPECELVRVRPDNWQAVLSESAPDLLLVESAWRGNDGSWQYRVAEYAAPPGRELPQLLDWCRRMGIPTVFWNKEDPPHFDDFIESACRFDWVFTTDANCVPRYRQRCGHDRVSTLPFAAQPTIHHPVLADRRNDKICFAGAYYGGRFDARRRAMEILLRPALAFDLDIYDRMHGAVGPGTENYRFPDEYRPHIVGRLDYQEMVEAYRRYRAFLNVNSVTDSETMFSRRVFELLACGTPVVSTESLGIRRLFPGIVPIATTPAEARAAITEVLTDDRSWRRRSALGIRRVMRAHTYAHRLRQICETVGMQMDPPSRPRLVLVVLAGSDPEWTAAQLAAQTMAPDRILLLANAHAGALERSLEGAGLGVPAAVVDRFSEAAAAEAGSLVSFIDGRHTYGPGYLEDALLALSYSGYRSTSMTAHFRLSRAGAVEYDERGGIANVPDRRVRGACLVCPMADCPSDVGDSVFSREELLLQHDCFARGPFEFLAGVSLAPDDERMEEIRLEEPDCHG
jgi:spore maturation protein CgeB